MRYTFAPLEGVTGYVYRNLHRRWFGGVERYYMPFIPVGQSRSFSSREWQDICPEHNESSDLVPQLLGKDAEGFLWAARELRALGYDVPVGLRRCGGALSRSDITDAGARIDC